MICFLSFIKQTYILLQKNQPILAKLGSKLASPMPVELRLALSLIITTPTHTPTPRKVERQLEINHIWLVGSWQIVCLVIFGGRGQLGVTLDRGDPPNQGKYNILNLKQTKYSWWKISGWLVCNLGWLELTVITGWVGLLCTVDGKIESK